MPKGGVLNANLSQLNRMVGALVIGAVALMPLLVPSSAQLASHLYSDNENGKAQAYFEAALRERGSQRELVLPLAKIASERGEHSQALAMLHSLKAHDLSVTDRELLRQELRAVGRTGDYISHLLYTIAHFRYQSRG